MSARWLGSEDERAAALLDEAGAPLVWGLLAFIVVAILVLAGGLP